MTLKPEEVGPSDVQALRDARVSEDGIVDAMQVCFCFNLIDRVADAFDWRLQTDDQFASDASFLLKKGYRLARPFRHGA